LRTGRSTRSSGQAALNTRTKRVGGHEPWRPEGCINFGEFAVKNCDLLKGKGAEMVRDRVLGALRAIVWQLHLRRFPQSFRPLTGAV